MKRAGKCVNKKAYPLLSIVIERASHRYKYHGQKLGYYECPTCLDFHLTSKYCNLRHKHNKWLKALAAELRKEEIKFDNKWFTPQSIKDKRRAKRLRYKSNKQAKQKALENFFYHPMKGKLLVKKKCNLSFAHLTVRFIHSVSHFGKN